MKLLALLLVTLLLSAAVGAGVYLAVNQTTNPLAQMAPCGRILFFGSPTTCPGCVEMEAVIARACISNLLRIDVDKEPVIAARWHIGNEIPVFIGLDDDGYEVRRIVGTCTANELCLLQFDAMKAGKSPIAMQPIPLVQQVAVESKVEHREESSKPAPSVSAPAADSNSIRGPEGWRLRLFYPKGDARGEKIKSQLSAMKAICAKYGFDANTTDGEMNHNWRKHIRVEDVTLVLIHPDGRIVYEAVGDDIPTGALVLREILREAARKSWGTAK